MNFGYLTVYSLYCELLSSLSGRENSAQYTVISQLLPYRLL